MCSYLSVPCFITATSAAKHRLATHIALIVEALDAAAAAAVERSCAIASSGFAGAEARVAASSQAAALALPPHGGGAEGGFAEDPGDCVEPAELVWPDGSIHEAWQEHCACRAKKGGSREERAPQASLRQLRR